MEKAAGKKTWGGCETWIRDGGEPWLSSVDVDPITFAKVFRKRHQRAKASPAMRLKARLLADLKRRTRR